MTLHITLRQRLVRPVSRAKADMLTLLAACLLVLGPHLMRLPASIAGGTVLLIGWRGWVTFAGNRLPPRWLLLPVAALAMGGIWYSYGTYFGRDAGVAMLTMLLVLKLLEMHAKRDLFVVLFLSFFLILTNFFYSQTIPTALLMLLAVVMLLTAQVSFQFTGTVPPLRHRLRLGAMILGLAIPLMLVLFLLFPRIQGPLWGLPGDANNGRSGLSDSMTPGTISSLALSDEIAFRAKFIDPVPPQSQLYWRAAVLTHYDGTTFTQLPQQPLPAGSVQARAGSVPIRYQVTMEPNGKNWLFALEVPTAPPSLGSGGAYLTNELQLLARERINSRIRYQVTSWPNFSLQADAPPEEINEALRLPAGFNPATAEFARQLLQRSTDPQELVTLVLRHFRQQAFSYTLEPPLLGRQAIDDFLFKSRAGFCEHYSGAFVVLMRDLGIPARVVTGYQGGEINSVDGYLEVRQSDAHAWAEVWLEHRGWLRVDPTAAVAPERIQRSVASRAAPRFFSRLATLAGGGLSWVGELRSRLDAVSNSWNQWVLGYSPDRQKNLFGSLGLGDIDWQKLTALMFGIGSAVMALMMGPLLMHRTRSDPVSKIYGQLCRRLARAGIDHPHYEGPRELRDRVAASASLSAKNKFAAVRFLEQYELLQYGTVTPRERNDALSQLKILLAASR